MNRTAEERLKLRLTKALQEWIETNVELEEGTMPYLGDDIAVIMADAALCVLRGMADAQAYMLANGLMTTDD